MPAVMEKTRKTASLPKARNLEAVNLPTVEYPPEVVARWDREFEIAKLKIATGELVPQTVEELAAELGIDFNDEDCDYDDES